jgi:hypothetical protein
VQPGPTEPFLYALIGIKVNLIAFYPKNMLICLYAYRQSENCGLIWFLYAYMHIEGSLHSLWTIVNKCRALQDCYDDLGKRWSLREWPGVLRLKACFVVIRI